MADSKLAEILAMRGARALHSPVVRQALGLASTDPGAPRQHATHTPARPQGGASRGPQSKHAKEESVQDKLFARMITVKDAGFAVPSGPGMLPGAALRPEVRKAFDDVGGVVGVDVTGLSPEEEQGLAMLLDPQWASRRAQ